MKKTLLFLAAAFVLCSCNFHRENVIVTKTPAERLQNRIDTLRHVGYMFGHQDDPFYGTTWEYCKDSSDTKLVTGDYPAIMGFDLGGIEMGDEKNLDSVPFDLIRKEAIKHYLRGGIITFSWHPRNPLTGGTAWDVSDTSVVESILPGGSQAEKFELWMNRVVTFLDKIKSDEGRRIPFILRPFHENNGSWFWWGEKLCSAEQYRQLWNMFQDYVSKALPNNIVWSYSPNLQGNWTTDKFMERYPGNDRVFIIGCDAYQWGTEQDFVSGLRSDLTFIDGFAKENGRIIALTECGYQNSPDSTWWTRVLKPIIDDYPISYLLPWRNYVGEHFGPAPDLCTKDDFIRFYEAPNTLFLEDIKPGKGMNLGRDSSEIIWM